MRKFSASVTVGAAVLLSIVWVAPGAVADEETTVDVVANATPADVAAAVDVPLLGAGESAIAIDRLEVEVSSEAAHGVSISAGEGTATIGLPFAGEANAGVSTEPGTVTYDNGNATSSVVLLHESGSVQIAAVIDSADAPIRYDYPLDLPEASSIVLRDGGAAVIDDATGEVLGSFAAPWAKDATGKGVPTRYELNGETLTQIVEHDSSFAYPVVADPTYTTSVIYLSRAQVVSMYNGLKGLNGVCSAFPIPWPASIACAGLAPGAQIEKAYWQKLRIKVTYFNCGFNYCSYTTYTAVR
ncbi:hypothetical protein J7E45_08690 [Microbacterium sp. ISL-59]|uniref:hypothetical protein n=1 Tax=Microbacterium sp. ISL-59 TaxID=2819159 RepID=UPI001BEAD919|nr:hypothetical protein [Microbacterium sp. ISL-59]MBT2495684.1 hypothetical protein [Microbacterium sp. ISL-59]